MLQFRCFRNIAMLCGNGLMGPVGESRWKQLEAIAVIQTRRPGNGGFDLFGIVQVGRSGHILNLF